MYTIPATRPRRIRTLMQRGRGNRRSDCLYFALPSEQAVNLCSAPAYLGACHPSSARGRKGPPPRPQLGSPWLTGGGGCRLNYSPHSIPSTFAFICSPLSLLFCCVCPLSGSHSESVLACCVVSYQLWRWPAIAVMQRRSGDFLGVRAHLQRRRPRSSPGSAVLDMLCLCTHQISHRAPTHCIGDFQVTFKVMFGEVSGISNMRSHTCMPNTLGI